MIRDLCQGLTGEDVRNMQGMLNLHLANKAAPPLVADGNFGSKTDARVRYFQQINGLWVDGIVGPHTRAAILDFRNVRGFVGGSPVVTSSVGGTSQAETRFRPVRIFNPLASSAAANHAFQLISSGTRNQLTDSANPQATAGEPPKSVSVTVQEGQQVTVPNWSFSPLVLTAQTNFFIRHNGGKPFVISPGLQVAANGVGSTAGPWSGQGFVQFGAAEITQGTIDWFNPFVTLALEKDANGPFNVQLAAGDQVNWNLIDDKLSLFVNGQAVTSVGLNNGLCSAPALQILGGVSFEFVLGR